MRPVLFAAAYFTARFAGHLAITLALIAVPFGAMGRFPLSFLPRVLLVGGLIATAVTHWDFKRRNRWVFVENCRVSRYVLLGGALFATVLMAVAAATWPALPTGP
jgi:hypothetical protein